MNKVDEIKNNFIEETYQDTWSVYEKSLTPDAKNLWDWIVLTASNKDQAKTFKEEINYRLSKGYLPKETKYLVLEDPDGKRVGSGGATLNVLRNIAELTGIKSFSHEKILVIHSGGDSKRIPQYSVCGKLFSPVQRELPDGRSSTLFDEFIIAFSAIPARMSPGMVVLSGDVLLVFNPLQVDLNYVDSAAISIKSPAEVGCNHGVFLTDPNNTVKQFLHKQSIDNLNKLGAINESNNVDIDTGAIYFNHKILNKLYDLICTNNQIDEEKYNLFVNESSRISFYGDFLYPLATDSTFDNYLKEAAEGSINENLISCRKLIWDSLSKFSMKVVKLSPANFIHFGTTHELLNMLTNDINKYKCLGWQKKVLSNVNNIDFVVNHSFVDDSADISPKVYIENSYIGKNVKIENNVILSNVHIENVHIPGNICMNTIYTNQGKFVTRIYSIMENPKIEKSTSTPFLNAKLENMIEKYGIDEKQIWPTLDKSLWKANLYTFENDNENSINSALMLYKIVNCTATPSEVNNYFNKERTSLFESFNNAQTDKIRQENMNNEFELRSYEFINLLKNKTDINIAKDILIKSPNIVTQINFLLKTIETYDYKIKSRTYLAVSQIAKEYNLNEFSSQEFENKCYEEIKKIINSSEPEEIDKDKIEKLAEVSLPIRVNFGGGWSDTPPYCNENGGDVLNAAFILDGICPIKAKIEKLSTNKIILSSIDLNVEKEITNIDELKSCTNNNDAFSLLKASLLVSGIVGFTDISLKSIFNRIGCGFKFTTDVSSIPKGSGLGTSSILAGACLKAIYKFLGIKISDEKLSYKVLEQEQLMGTGGGWQDQIGGIVPGIKLIHTNPGENQKFEIEQLKLNSNFVKELNTRFALIYTGQRRLAKNLLRDIMNNYISNNKKTLDTIQQIKNKAFEMKESLNHENIEEFAKLLNEHWELSKSLDKGCTNVCINQILSSCDDLIYGKMICGAGGGGFLQVVLNKDVSFDDLNKRITEVFQDSGIKAHKVTLFQGDN